MLLLCLPGNKVCDWFCNKYRKDMIGKVFGEDKNQGIKTMIFLKIAKKTEILAFPNAMKVCWQEI